MREIRLIGLVALLAAAPAALAQPHGDSAGEGGEPTGVSEPAASPTPSATPQAARPEDESVVLNFEGADIREVIHSLGDALGINYSIDPSVSGQVTIRTTGKIPRRDLFAVFNQVLRSYGLAAMKVGDVYYINQVALAKTKASMPRTLPAAKEAAEHDEFVIEIVKVEHIAAQEMLNVVQPFVTPGGDVFPYPRANLLIISDLKSNVERLRELVETFDRDTFRDLHAKIYKIEHASVEELGEELLSILDTYGVTPAAAEERGIYVIPLVRLSSVAIIAFNPTVFPEVERWLKVLDVPPEEGAGRTVRVYAVENAKAADLAAILNELYGGESTTRGAAGRQYTPFASRRRETGGVAPAPQQRGAAARAPGRQGMFDEEYPAYDEYLEPSPQFRGRQAERIGQTRGGFGRGGLAGGAAGGVGRGGVGTFGGRGAAGPTGVVIAGGEPGSIFRGEVRIVADEISNSLVILATKKDYEEIVEVLRKLDVVPRQALIEVLVAEVTLDDEFSFGVEWFLAKRKLTQILGAGEGTSTTADGTTSGTTSQGPSPADLFGSLRSGGLRLPDVTAAGSGLFAVVTDNRQFLALLNALAGAGKLTVLSSPHILTADNREAHILVGEEVPILTTQTTSGAVTLEGGVSGILQNIQYRDTGVLLTVLPQVNSQGLVNMEISQEVSNIKSTSTGGIASPTFSTRESQTTVVVQSGETVVISGIIEEQTDHTRSGIPYLMDIPVLGRAFRVDSDKTQRVELIVLLTPHVVRDRQEARTATEEFKAKLFGLGEQLERWERRIEESQKGLDGGLRPEAD